MKENLRGVTCLFLRHAIATICRHAEKLVTYAMDRIDEIRTETSEFVERFCLFVQLQLNNNTQRFHHHSQVTITAKVTTNDFWVIIGLPKVSFYLNLSCNMPFLWIMRRARDCLSFQPTRATSLFTTPWVERKWLHPSSRFQNKASLQLWHLCTQSDWRNPCKIWWKCRLRYTSKSKENLSHRNF